MMCDFFLVLFLSTGLDIIFSIIHNFTISVGSLENLFCSLFQVCYNYFNKLLYLLWRSNMGIVYKKALRFKKEHPSTIGWRLKKNSSIVEKHLNPGEKVLYVFVAQKNDNPLDVLGTAVIALTDKRILIGRKRVVFGYFLDSVTPDLFNDLKVKGGLIWGKVYIDTVKEFITLSNIGVEALPEIETEISSYMMEMKRKYYSHSHDDDDDLDEEERDD